MSTPWTPKDVLSVGLSACALIVSLTTTYFNLFRHVDDVQVRIADFVAENTSEPSKNRIVTQLAFLNRGNQPLLVTGVEFVVDTSKDLSHEPFGGSVFVPDCTFPFVLEKGQVRLLEIASQLKHVESNLSRQALVAYYGLKFASIDSRGNEQGAKLVFGEIHIKEGRTFAYDWQRSSGVSAYGSEKLNFRVAAPCKTHRSNLPGQ